MERSHALLISVLLIVAFWWFLPTILDWGLGIEIPFLGFLGIKPFEFLESYSAIIIGVFGVTVMYFLVKNRRGGERR